MFDVIYGHLLTGKSILNQFRDITLHFDYTYTDKMHTKVLQIKYAIRDLRERAALGSLLKKIN